MATPNHTPPQRAAAACNAAHLKAEVVGQRMGYDQGVSFSLQRVHELHDRPADPGGNLVWSTGGAFCPEFATAFPRREQGVLFGDATLPAFGIWSGIDAITRADLAAQVRILHHRAGDDWSLELTPADGSSLRIARFPEATRSELPLSELAKRLGAVPSPGLWSRITNRAKLLASDGVKIPILTAATDDATVRVELRGGDRVEPSEDLTLGRGEIYKRYFVADGPFGIWLGNDTTPTLVAWFASLSP